MSATKWIIDDDRCGNERVEAPTLPELRIKLETESTPEWAFDDMTHEESIDFCLFRAREVPSDY
ncbi:MAG TPA: hypothetical protein PLA90_04355 [Candidatus Sumerlaeota bacterium]|nr:hypothetical protein [Candidatus Sumerlaeota bacterium]